MKKRRFKENGIKTVVWIFLLAVVTAFVVIAFPQTPEVEDALNPKAYEIDGEREADNFEGNSRD